MASPPICYLDEEQHCCSRPGLRPSLTKPDCSLHGCYVCADLEELNEEISNTNKHLSALLNQRRKILSKPSHDACINRMPVEILSSIFYFVKNAVFDFEFVEYPGRTIYEYPDRQPTRCPALLVGAVCKKWRDVSLTTPQLWTDIIINLKKYREGQLNMVKEWARRSGALPLDITIISNVSSSAITASISTHEALLTTLASLASRWNNIAIHALMILFQLVSKLQENAPLNRLFLFNLVDQGQMDIGVQHHPQFRLQPRRMAWTCGDVMPWIEWCSLVCLHIDENQEGSETCGKMLHVIRHAPNLRQCIGGTSDNSPTPEFPIPTSPFLHQSLMYLKTHGSLIQYLNLPSLRHLDYVITKHVEQTIDWIAKFLDRSCVQLDTFVLRFEGHHLYIPPVCFQKLPAITSLNLCHDYGLVRLSNINELLLAFTFPSTQPVLPRLQQLSMRMYRPPASSWSLFSRLFPMAIDAPPPDIEASSDSTPPNRPLSRVQVDVCLPVNDSSLEGVTMDRETLMHLLEVKKSGVDLTLVIYDKCDLFCHLAKIYNVDY